MQVLSQNVDYASISNSIDVFVFESTKYMYLFVLLVCERIRAIAPSFDQ